MSLKRMQEVDLGPCIAGLFFVQGGWSGGPHPSFPLQPITIQDSFDCRAWGTEVLRHRGSSLFQLADSHVLGGCVHGLELACW